MATRSSVVHTGAELDGASPQPHRPAPSTGGAVVHTGAELTVRRRNRIGQLLPPGARLFIPGRSLTVRPSGDPSPSRHGPARRPTRPEPLDRIFGRVGSCAGQAPLGTRASRPQRAEGPAFQPCPGGPGSRPLPFRRHDLRDHDAGGTPAIPGSRRHGIEDRSANESWPLCPGFHRPARLNPHPAGRGPRAGGFIAVTRASPPVRPPR